MIVYYYYIKILTTEIDCRMRTKYIEVTRKKRLNKVANIKNVRSLHLSLFYRLTMA